MALPDSEQVRLKQLAADFAVQIQAQRIQRIPRFSSKEAQNFFIEELLTVHGLDPRLVGGQIGETPVFV
jgi:hypothetical protein